MSRLILSCLWCLLLAGPAAAGEPTGPRWPLDLPTRYLTSNFMEYRPGRFHAGLDLKTQTVTGFAARAVEDGWIVRVRATPTAYGRAVYLRGESGRTYVYAHLGRFSDRLRGLVEARREVTGTYRTRLQFKAGQVPVRRGEVLGLTGQSGTGGPHLHFEVRNAGNRPIDPQGAGFAVGDTMTPVIHRIRAWPVSPAARIQGEAVAHLLAAPAGLQGELPELSVSGPVAFSARIVDQSDIRGHRLEPSLIEVWLDGQRVYQCRNESFAFAENALERLEWIVLPGIREHWLHRHPAVALTGRAGGLWYLGPAGQGLSEGRHRIRIVTTDWAGNTAEADFALVVGAGAAPGAWRATRTSPALVSADSLHSIEITPFFDVDSEVVRAERPHLRRREYSPLDGDPVMAPLVVYSDQVALSEIQREAAASQGLKPLGPGRQFVAAGWPLAASLPVRLTAPAEAADKTWGLYRWDDPVWDWAGTWPGAEAAGPEVAVTIDRTGLYAVLADERGPLISPPPAPIAIGPGPDSTIEGVTLPRWEVLPVGLVDNGCGLAAETITVHLDGRSLIVEPDLPRDRILIELPDGLAAGTHELVIEAADRVGHPARRAVAFTARD